MTRLITVWFITPSQKVLLKKKAINNRVFFLPFETWMKRGESIFGAVNRIKEEFQNFIYFVTPGKYEVKFEEFDIENFNTKIGEIQRIHFQCRLPFEPILTEEIIIVDRENLNEIRKMMMKKDYERLLRLLGIQTTLI